ncbi:MAG: 2,5-diketo-D-gluconate reductase [Solirubrobacterales bacterium]|nr:2,5-diketo-D-gluconate reductase [Solirubrobacterales bacterium]
MADIPTVTLSDGVEIPQLGYGVFQIPPDETQRAVEAALEAGYRHIDTAAAYRNERGVAAGIAASGVPRGEIFITTKLWNSEQGFDSTLAAFERSTEALDTDHVDLYLIHWPIPSRDLYLDTWRAFERIHGEGGARSIGVSNFRVADLERLRQEAETMPMVNQIELHPLLQQAELRAWHAEHGVVTEAWSPLAQGEVLEDETLMTIAAHHQKTVAQVILRWLLQRGHVVIPTSVTPERIRANLDLFDFELSEDDLAAIARLEAGHRTGPDPETFGAA